MLALRMGHGNMPVRENGKINNRLGSVNSLQPSHPPSGLPDTTRHHLLTGGTGDMDSSAPSSGKPCMVDIY